MTRLCIFKNCFFNGVAARTFYRNEIVTKYKNVCIKKCFINKIMDHTHRTAVAQSKSKLKQYILSFYQKAFLWVWQSYSLPSSELIKHIFMASHNTVSGAGGVFIEVLFLLTLICTDPEPAGRTYCFTSSPTSICKQQCQKYLNCLWANTFASVIMYIGWSTPLSSVGPYQDMSCKYSPKQKSCSNICFSSWVWSCTLSAAGGCCVAASAASLASAEDALLAGALVSST